VRNWNRCVELARGTWLKFLFQDDFLEPQCIQRMLEAQHENYPLIVCRRELVFEADVPESVRSWYHRFVSEDGIPRKFPDMRVITADRFLEKFLDHPTENWLGEPTATLIHRSAFERFGLFNPMLISLCDWEFCARVAVNTGLCYVEFAGASFRVHERSASGMYRSSGLHRARYIDPLIIRHDMAYAGTYAPVRSLASQRVPPVNLIQKLLYEARAVRLLAEDHAYDPVEPNRKLLSEWEFAVRKYRRFKSVPISYVFDWGKRKANSFWQKTLSACRE
jgi:GT2 family glycosyltransferase